MTAANPLNFRDPARARGLALSLARLLDAYDTPPLRVMHVCGTHEQAIARYGLREMLPEGLELFMGPGCPVCVTNAPEVDEGVALVRLGCRVATYGDMLRVPGSSLSLADARAEGGDVEVVYSLDQAMEMARQRPEQELVFFATGFETTAVATAAALVAGVPENFSVLSAHKYIPPAMDLVASLPDTKIDGFLAAGHAAIITGCKAFEPLVQKHGVAIVVGGFEPLDILAALVQLVEMVVTGEVGVKNAYPRCVSYEGNGTAQEVLWRVFECDDGDWRGIASIPQGNLRLRSEFAAVDARRRFNIDPASLYDEAASELARRCICGTIMTGQAQPTDCPLFGKECSTESPIGACMVSTEGSCRIWQQYGHRPVLGVGP